MAAGGLSIGHALDNALGSLGTSIGQVGPVLDNAAQQLGGSIGDLGGLIQPEGGFQTCIATALGIDSTLYAFPQDILLGLTNKHPYNLDYPVTPAAIVYPRNAIDVSNVVVCASQYGIAVQAKSGGHNYLNLGYGGVDGALCVDVQHMNDFDYNSNDQTVTFGPGNKLRDLDQQLEAINRVMAYGSVGDIGTSGHIAIGGLGTLSRLLGLAADQVVAVNCVLGDGSIVRASALENPDLFFAIKGAAWSFCIMTEITMQTSPPPSAVTNFQYNVTVGKFADLSDTFKRWQRFVSDPQMTRSFTCTLTLSEPGMLVFQGIFFGDETAFSQLNFEAVLPFGQQSLGISVVSNVATGLLHGLLQLSLDVGGSIPANFYGNSLKVTPSTLLSDSAVDSMFQYFDTADKGTLIWFVVWDLEGGAISDVPQDSTAYWHRDALYFQQGYFVQPFGHTTPTQRQFLVGLRQLCQQLVPNIGEGSYAGYADEYLRDPLGAYWGGNVPRLVQIKGRYDPGNVFRNPQSIPTPWGQSWVAGPASNRWKHKRSHARA